MNRKTLVLFAFALLVSLTGLQAATEAPSTAETTDELQLAEIVEMESPADAPAALPETTPEPLFASTASCYDTCQAAYLDCLGGECNKTSLQCSRDRSQCYGCCNLYGSPCLAC